MFVARHGRSRQWIRLHPNTSIVDRCFGKWVVFGTHRLSRERYLSFVVHFRGVERIGKIVAVTGPRRNVCEVIAVARCVRDRRKDRRQRDCSRKILLRYTICLNTICSCRGLPGRSNAGRSKGYLGSRGRSKAERRFRLALPSPARRVGSEALIERDCSSKRH